MLIDKLKELNETLYEAFGELKENQNNINKPEHQDGIADKIYELYELDYKLIRGTMEAEDKSAGELELEKLARDNEFKRRKEELTPIKKRRWYAPWLFKTNRAEDLLTRESEANADIKLNEREKAIEQLEKIVAAADDAAPEVFTPTSWKQRREQKRQERREKKERKRAEKQAKKSKSKAEKSENEKRAGE